jgi:hypothetical protein
LLAILRLLFIRRLALIAESLILRKQLAVLQELKLRPRNASASTRLSMLALAQFFDRREALIIVKPKTVIGWYRAWSDRPDPFDVAALPAPRWVSHRFDASSQRLHHEHPLRKESA